MFFQVLYFVLYVILIIKLLHTEQQIVSNYFLAMERHMTKTRRGFM